MSNPFERRTEASPEFDFSPGTKYTADDLEKMAAGPDEALITEKKIQLLDAVERAGKKVKITLMTGGEVSGRLEGAALAGDYVCGQELIHADDVQAVELL